MSNCSCFSSSLAFKVLRPGWHAFCPWSASLHAHNVAICLAVTSSDTPLSWQFCWTLFFPNSLTGVHWVLQHVFPSDDTITFSHSHPQVYIIPELTSQSLIKAVIVFIYLQITLGCLSSLHLSSEWALLLFLPTLDYVLQNCFCWHLFLLQCLTQSQNHSVAEAGVIWSNPRLLQQGHPEPLAQAHVWVAFKYLQGEREAAQHLWPHALSSAALQKDALARHRFLMRSISMLHSYESINYK